MIFYKILKFHDISMTGKAPIIFQGFPGAVGTLDISKRNNIFKFWYIYGTFNLQNLANLAGKLGKFASSAWVTQKTQL